MTAAAAWPTGLPRRRQARHLRRRGPPWLVQRARQMQPGAFLERLRAAKSGGAGTSPSPASDSFPEATGAAELGLNTVVFYDEDKYGQVRDVVRDMQRLGVDVLRQPGRIQLLLSHLLYEQEGGKGVPLEKLQWDVRVTPDLMTMSSLRARITGSFALRWLLDVCRRMTLMGVDQKLLVTFLDLGEGAPTNWSESVIPEGASPTDESGSAEPYVQPVGLEWGSGHIGRSVNDWTTGDPVNFDSGRGELWDTYTLDPANAYKRTFYAMVASILGDWLQRHGSVVRPHLMGIEIGNEQETFHARDTSEGEVADGDAWGRLYYDCASAIRARCDWVPLWLPALASARPDGDGQDAVYWPGKVRFVDDLLATVRDLCAVHKEYALHELVAGVDYHYYNMFPGDARPLHYMALQLRELRGVVDLFDWAGGSVPLVTCFETGVNVLCTEDGEPGFETLYTNILSGHERGCEEGALSEVLGGVIGPSYRPEVWAGHNTGALAFQAQSVWMRLGVARAAAANIVGWHCHIGNAGSAFAGTGLRFDFQETWRPDLKEGEDDPSTAWKRPSWFALRDFGRWLCPATTVRVLAPEVLSERWTSWQAAYNGLDEGALEPEDCLWVIEFEGGPIPGRTTGWAYLCFIDPVWPSTAPSADRPAYARLTFRAAKTRPRVFQFDTILYERPKRPDDLTKKPRDRFPAEEWPTTPPARQAVTREGRYFLTPEYQVARGQSPLLVLSSQPLSISSSTVVTG